MKNYEIIQKMFDEWKERNGLKNEDLLKDGAVHYMNGNDGTDFDWQVNDRVCEFYVFYKESEMGALRIDFRKDGKMNKFFYEDGAWGPSAEEFVESPIDTAELAAYLYGTFDQHGIWDQPITDWTFTEMCWIEDEEEDDYYEEEDGWY